MEKREFKDIKRRGQRHWIIIFASVFIVSLLMHFLLKA